MARDEEDSPKKPKAFVVGQDVSAFSIADLDAEILRLREEIDRLSGVREASGRHTLLRMLCSENLARRQPVQEINCAMCQKEHVISCGYATIRCI